MTRHRPAPHPAPRPSPEESLQEPASRVSRPEPELGGPGPTPLGPHPWGGPRPPLPGSAAGRSARNDRMAAGTPQASRGAACPAGGHPHGPGGACSSAPPSRLLPHLCRWPRPARSSGGQDSAAELSPRCRRARTSDCRSEPADGTAAESGLLRTPACVTWSPEQHRAGQQACPASPTAHLELGLF